MHVSQIICKIYQYVKKTSPHFTVNNTYQPDLYHPPSLDTAEFHKPHLASDIQVSAHNIVQWLSNEQHQCWVKRHSKHGSCWTSMGPTVISSTSNERWPFGPFNAVRRWKWEHHDAIVITNTKTLWQASLAMANRCSRQQWNSSLLHFLYAIRQSQVDKTAYV